MCGLAVPKACPKINDDVLSELMLYIGPKEQAIAARVASYWTGPAQRALYRSITFDTCEKAPDSSGQRLVRTLRSHPHLWALVRQLSIHSARDEERRIPGRSARPEDRFSQLDWVALLPQGTLRNFTYICSPRDTLIHELLQKDAIRTISHLTANGPDTFPALKACFELPMLETLELDLSEWRPRRDPGDRPSFKYRLQLDGAKVPNLKHLYIHVPSYRNDVVMIIIAAFAAQLHSLHIHVPRRQSLDFNVNAKAAWTEEFLEHIRRARRLTRLVFSGFLQMVPHPFSRMVGYDPQIDAVLESRIFEPLRQKRHLHPFLDEVAQQSAVEHLCCTDGSYTDELFQKLPRRVKLLEFYVEESFECEGALLDLLRRRVGKGKDGRGLRMVRFFACEERRTLFKAIEEACEESGIAFEFFPVVPPLHHPPTRPAILWD
ncbi:hypothetical protein C8T65DRAFT_663119 [Cerioporus squamosus]|nr:hypothetical protein C8T65DRAFT_663119 [Cerioporus squamosus]